MSKLASPLSAEITAPRYDLNSNEMAHRESEMVDMVKDAYGETLAALWIPSESPYADVIRTHEAATFKEMPEIMAPYEDESAFLTLLDTRNETHRVVHGFRISSPALTRGNTENEVNIAFVQDLVSSGQITEADFVDYYTRRGVILDNCVSVESNFRVGEKVADLIPGVATPQVGYLSLFNSISQGVDVGEGAVFAHLNRPATVSLSRLTVDYEPVMGNPDLMTPTVGGQYDDKYKPVAVTSSAHNMELFSNLGAIAPPVIDLR